MYNILYFINYLVYTHLIQINFAIYVTLNYNIYVLFNIFVQNTIQEVSIFEFISNDDILGNENAKKAIKHLKTLKHPNFISFLESSEVKNNVWF